MNEVSNIVHNAKQTSLILLDEVGRGTGTKEGMALASAIITYVTGKIGAKTMFATHFHELNVLANENPKIKNYKALTAQIDGEIVFLHKIEPGIENNSFGIEVAKMAGLPKEILNEARRLYTIESASASESKNEKVNKKPIHEIIELPIKNHPIVSKIQNIDINLLTPMEAIIVLGDLVKESKL